MKPDIIVLAWYRREDYDRVYALGENGGGMEPSFDVWEKYVKSTMPVIKEQGVPIKKIYIKPDEFAAWLKAKNLQSKPDTRALYVQEIGVRQSKH